MIPLFSIIIPTFNSSETLEVALESIASQTYTNIEVLIMDGLSTDNTVEIATRFNSKINKLHIVSESDKGIYDAMNKGIKIAKGEWLYFMGSDDSLYNKNVLANVTEFIKTTNASVLYGSAKIIGDTGWACDGDLYDGAFDIHKLLNQNICHQAIFYKRQFIKNEIGFFNIDYKKSADWDFNIRCWAKKSFIYRDIIVANFIAGGFSTQSTDNKIIEDFLENILKYFSINPFHSLVNTTKFIFYNQVVKKQQKDYAVRYKIEKVKKRIFNKLRRL